VENTIDEAVEKILNRMNIPSKSDIETLSRRIVALSAKIDDLKPNAARPPKRPT